MLALQEGFRELLQKGPESSAIPLATQLLSAVLILGQLIISLRRALRQTSFSSYGLSFHSRYIANINFMTNALGVIGNGYSKVKALDLSQRVHSSRC